MDKQSLPDRQIKFTSSKVRELITYETRPVINIVRASLHSNRSDWVSLLSGSFLTIKISCQDNRGHTVSIDEDTCPVGALISPHHTKPSVEINKTFQYSQTNRLSPNKQVGKWTIEVALHNIELGENQYLMVEYLDSKHISKRLDDWIQRVDAFASLLQEWLQGMDDYDVRKSNRIIINEEMMRAFDIPPREISSFDIFRKSKIIMLVKPLALWVIGANGRIDLLTENNNYIVVDRGEHFKQAHWQVFNNDRRANGKDFTRDEFLKIIKA